MSANHDYARSFQDYTRDFSDQLFTELFYNFQTADLVTTHEGVKGEKILTQLELGQNFARRWGKAFTPPANLIAFKPRKIKTALNKVDFSITPQDYESSYLGQFRKKGQKLNDMPFEGYTMDKVLAKLNTEFEDAIWQAVESDTASDGDYLRETFDGYLKIIADEITAGTITPVATGAITQNDIIDQLRDMWEEVGVPYKNAGVDIMMSYSLYDTYRIAYKNAYKVDPAYSMITASGYEGILFELGNSKTRIIPVVGLGSSNRIIITPRENLHMAIDDPSDVMFNVEGVKRELHFWMDFRMGAQILIIQDGILVVNDQV